MRQLLLRLQQDSTVLLLPHPRVSFEGFMSVYTEAGEEKKRTMYGQSLDKDSDLTKEALIRSSILHSRRHIIQRHLWLRLWKNSESAVQVLMRRQFHTIIARRYVAKENKNLYLTEIGEVVNNIMKQSFPSIVDVNFTANMESLLDGVAEGKVRWKTIIENFYPDLEEACRKSRKRTGTVEIQDEVTDVICEQCGRNMVIKYGPHGKFLACPGFPECRNTKPYLEKIGVPCPSVEKILYP